MRAGLILFAALSACSNHPSASPADSHVDRDPPTAVPTPDDRIDCAPAGSATFTRVCIVEDGDDVFTVRNPDGGFHRLAPTRDGRGVVAADGADPARVTIVGDGVIEVVIGGDRYRLPATIRPATPR